MKPFVMLCIPDTEPQNSRAKGLGKVHWYGDTEDVKMLHFGYVYAFRNIISVTVCVQI
jgi:hypothetical protein